MLCSPLVAFPVQVGVPKTPKAAILGPCTVVSLQTAKRQSGLPRPQPPESLIGPSSPYLKLDKQLGILGVAGSGYRICLRQLLYQLRGLGYSR